jgi:hypothetical protein
MNISVLEDSFYDKWRRQKNYETEINTLNNKLRKMQEKLEGLQQKHFQVDLFRGRTSLPV